MSYSETMKWYRTRSYSDDVTQIDEPHTQDWLRPNIWHIRGRDRDLLFDSGMGLIPLRSELQAYLDKEVLAVASHTHFDHIGGHYEFEHRLCHANEQDVLKNPNNDNSLVNQFLSEDYLDENGFEGSRQPDVWLKELPWEGYSSHRDYNVRPAPPTRLIEDGDVIDLGDRVFLVLHLPGHSPGSIGLFEEKTGVFLSGDAVYNPTDGPLVDFYDHSDDEDYLATMIRIRELPVGFIGGGHYMPFGKDRFVEIVDDFISKKRAAVCPMRSS